MGKRWMLLSELIILGILSLGQADQRLFVWTYEYQTMPAGEAELESYFTLFIPDDSSEIASIEHQLELEVGMNDRFDMGIYHVLEQQPDDALRYIGFKLRARYRFGEKGKYLFDPIAYVEYLGKPRLSEPTLEFKLILARDLGGFNIALNPVLEMKREHDEWELEPEYAVGLGYQLGDLLDVGLEAKGSADVHYLGPVLAHGTERFWVTLGSAFSLGEVPEGKPHVQIRMLLGISL